MISVGLMQEKGEKLLLLQLLVLSRDASLTLYSKFYFASSL